MGNGESAAEMPPHLELLRQTLNLNCMLCRHPADRQRSWLARQQQTAAQLPHSGTSDPACRECSGTRLLAC
jgi:hypothetical protein